MRGNKKNIQQLLTLIDGKNYVSWSRKRDDLDVMRDIMWAHPETRFNQVVELVSNCVDYG